MGYVHQTEVAVLYEDTIKSIIEGKDENWSSSNKHLACMRTPGGHPTPCYSAEIFPAHQNVLRMSRLPGGKNVKKTEKRK